MRLRSKNNSPRPRALPQNRPLAFSQHSGVPYRNVAEVFRRGYPGKMADYIADSLIQEHLAGNPEDHFDIQVALAETSVMVTGQCPKNFHVDKEEIRGIINRIGYRPSERHRFNHFSCSILDSLNQQSPELAAAIQRRRGRSGGANAADDQAAVYGFATNETRTFMPLSAMLAHNLVEKIDDPKNRNVLGFLGPDGKLLVEVEYQDGQAKVKNLHASLQISGDALQQPAIFRTNFENWVLAELPDDIKHPNLSIVTNFFEIGGPQVETGMTGRQLQHDNYGSFFPATQFGYSGKDFSKIHRSGSYAARYAALNAVAANLVDWCEVFLNYEMGSSKVPSLHVNSNFAPDSDKAEALCFAIQDVMPLSPAAIHGTLGLDYGVLKQTALNGHFGNPEFPWEKSGRKDALRQSFNGRLDF